MAVDVSKIPNNSKFDPVRVAILNLQGQIEDTGAAVGNGTLTINTSGALTGSGTFTANQTGPSTITIGLDDSSYLTEEVNDLTSAVTWANVPDANITESSVTQHEAALSITESQISDLGNYLDLDNTGTQTISGSIIISEDLTVSGETTYINTNHLNIGDNIIQLNADIGGSTAPTEDAGFYVNRGSQPDASFLWDEDDDRFSTYANALATASLYIGSNQVINSSRQFLGSSTISSTVPYFTFSGDSNTGVGRATNNKVSLIAEGTKALEASNTGVSITGDLEVGGTFTADGVTFPNDIITSADFSATDNRFKLTLTQEDAGTIEASFDDVVLSESMAADYIPYVKVGGGDGDTTNAILNDSFLKINGSTLELDWGDTVGVYTARDIKMRKDGGGFGTYYEATYAADSVSFLHYASASDIDTAKIGATTTGRVRINDTYNLPAGDGTSGQVLTTNGSGDLSWADASGGGDLDLQDVTDNGATTTRTIQVGGVKTDLIQSASQASESFIDLDDDLWFAGAVTNVLTLSSKSHMVFVNDTNSNGTTENFGFYTQGTTDATATKLFEIKQNGNIDVTSGAVQIGGTTVIDSSRNLDNIGTISSGDITINKSVATINMGYQGGPHGINFYDDASGNNELRWGFYYRTSPDTITFETGGTSAKFTLDTSGNLTVTGDVTAPSATIGGILLQEAADRGGLLEVNRKGTNTWSGIQVNYGDNHWSWMGNTNYAGLYDDKNSKWVYLYSTNNHLELYYNGTAQARTQNGYFLAVNEFRSAVFRGTNTAYHVTPAGTSNLNALTLGGNLTISKDTPSIYLYDSSTTANYPEIRFNTTNNQGVKLVHNEFDGDLPIAGYGLILTGDDANTQFGTTGVLSFIVHGNIYAGGTTNSTVSRVLTTADEGSGNGLDADTVDGLQASQFLRSDADDVVSAGVTYTWNSTDTHGLQFTNASYGTSLYVGGWSTSNSNNISRLRTSSGNFHLDSAANGNIYLNHYSGGIAYIGNGGGYTYAYNSVRSPIFYDSDSTTYYTNPASTSNMNRIEAYGEVLSAQVYNDPDVVFAVLEQDTTNSVRQKFRTTSSAVERVEDATAPSNGCFQITGQFYPEAFTPYYKIDTGDEYTFEFWIKWVSGTDTDSRIYAGARFYDANKSYLGNSQRYWGEGGVQVDANSNNAGWYHVSGTLGPNRGGNTGDIPTAAEWMRLLFLFNYNGGSATVTRYCGLKVYKSDKTVTKLYRKTLGSEFASSANRDLVIDSNGDINSANLDVNGNISFTGDSRRIDLSGGTTNSQNALIIGESNLYGVRFRWDSGASLHFDGYWNTSTTGAENRDLGYIHVNNRQWFLESTVLTNALHLDTIYHRNDTNTYTQFHAADQWRVVTGGTERLEVNNTATTVTNTLIANDYVGVGTTPISKFHVAHTSFPQVRINDDTGGGEAGMRLRSYNGTIGLHCDIFAKMGSSNETGYLGFRVPYNGERLRIHSNGSLSLGIPGNGGNTNGRYLSFEGNTDGSGEGSGRLFFSEHNSTTASMDNYGMSIGYRGGGTSVTTAGGNSWTGLSQIGNGQWGMWGHDNSLAGNLIMYGDRQATYVDFAGNNIQGINNIYVANAIYHTGDTNTYFQFHGNDICRIVIAGSEVTEWGNSYMKMRDNDTIRLGEGSDFRMWHDGTHTYFRNYNHAGGNIYWTGEDTEGSNLALLYMITNTSRPYLRLFENGEERLRTTSAGVTVYGSLTATGDVIAYSTSDKRLKDNIKLIDNAIDKVQKISGVTFDWNDKQDLYEGHDIGVIAQEVEEVLPEVVSERENGYKAVKYEKIVPLLIEAIKEQQKQIDELKSLINK